MNYINTQIKLILLQLIDKQFSILPCVSELLSVMSHYNSYSILLALKRDLILIFGEETVCFLYIVFCFCLSPFKQSSPCILPQ